MSAIICTRNRPADLAVATAALLDGEGPGIELIIIDQSDGPESELALGPRRSDPRLRYQRSAARGKGAGLNEALQLARGSVLVCTDDDCRPPAGWVAGMARVLQSHPDNALAFCTVVPVPHDPEIGYVPAYRISRSRQLCSLRDICGGLGIGAGMAVRRDFLRSLGGFDEHFGPGGRFPSADEWDLAMRALLKGYRVFETPELTIVHDGFRTFEEGRTHAARDWVALGAVCAKPLRAGYWSAALVAAWVLFAKAAWPLLADLLRLRKPRGFGRISAFLRGFADGAATPVDKSQLRFIAPH